MKHNSLEKNDSFILLNSLTNVIWQRAEKEETSLGDFFLII